MKVSPRLVEIIGPPLLRAVGPTFRITETWAPEAAALRDAQRIFAFWHGRMIVPAWTHRFRKVGILISSHRDGEMIARVVARLGFVPVRGSSTRGGSAGLRAILRAARAGHDIAFTPDGPRGPVHRVHPGVIYAAGRTGLPLIPSSVEASHGWIVGSWDEFLIPRPFARVVIHQGAPMHVPKRVPADEIEGYCRELERRMVLGTKTALERLGETHVAGKR